MPLNSAQYIISRVGRDLVKFINFKDAQFESVNQDFNIS